MLDGIAGIIGLTGAAGFAAFGLAAFPPQAVSQVDPRERHARRSLERRQQSPSEIVCEIEEFTPIPG